MNKEKISVVVPVYNVEKYLHKCVDSIIDQTYKNLEIILVDDGATDMSGKICDEYLEKDSRIKVIHKINGGLSDARNTGMGQAQGKYIIFIDSDDYIDENMLMTLYTNLTESKADMAVCGIWNVYQEQKWAQCEQREKFVCDNVEALRLLMIGEKIPGSICNKLLKWEIASQFRFQVGKHYEDVFFHTDMMPSIQSVSVDTTPLYYYVHREGSITTRNFDKTAMDIIEAYERNYQMIQSKYPQISDVAKFRAQWANFVVMDRMMESETYWEYAEYKQVKAALKKNVLSIFFSKYFRKTRRISALALGLNIKLYYILSKMNRKQYGKIA